MTTTPRFSALTADACAEILERHHVGRLAFLNGPRVDVRPLGYVAKGNWMFLRSAHGEKLDALEQDGSPIERMEYDRALKALRRAMPETLKADDPVPDRQLLLGISVHEVSGRSARTR